MAQVTQAPAKIKEPLTAEQKAANAAKKAEAFAKKMSVALDEAKIKYTPEQFTMFLAKATEVVKAVRASTSGRVNGKTMYKFITDVPKTAKLSPHMIAVLKVIKAAGPEGINAEDIYNKCINEEGVVTKSDAKKFIPWHVGILRRMGSVE